MFIALVIVALLVASGWLFMRGESFGALATGERLKRIQSSPQYREGRFQNLHPTPNLAEGAGMVKIMFTFFFGKDKRNKPSQKLPSEKTDLLRLDPSEDILVWFGHSSYFLQVNGKKILVDPVFSGHASPVRFTTGSYKGSDNYTPQDMPGIDYLVITHDHWDHLDRATVAALQPKVQRVITGIGTGAHLERWGYAPAVITELDWQQSYMPQQGFTFISLPARHFSGRGFTRDQSLWMSFAFLTPSYRLYLGGDSGYDTHFAAIGEQYGPFDLAILECGQYNLSWPYIHMQPEEVVKAAKDLTAKKLLPVHWAKFSLGLHAWDEPIERLTREAGKQGMAVAHPMIGAKMLLKESQLFDRWWLFENRP